MFLILRSAEAYGHRVALAHIRTIFRGSIISVPTKVVNM
jgi:hypothetical protein